MNRELVKNYFSKYKSKDKYYVDMKTVVGLKLKEEGLILREIAEVLDCHTGNVKSILSRGNIDEFIRANFYDMILAGEYPITSSHQNFHLKKFEI